mgnify:FL=1
MSKLYESKRGLLFVFTLILVAVLLVVSWSIGPPRADLEVQRTLANTLRDIMTFGLPILIGSIAATDWREAPFTMGTNPPPPPASTTPVEPPTT